MLSAPAQLATLRRGVVSIIPEDEMMKRLEEGRALRVKLGVDPTAPDIHLGHTVQLTKLRQFQDLGHQAVLIIGDFTALIGDPSGRSATRPPLSAEDVAAHARTYESQVFKILDRERTEVHRNSSWLAGMGLTEIIRLASQMTVARLLERDDFRQRYRAGTPIGMHEFLYPLMQGHDSVVVRADVELGGTDQTFNLLVGRDLQRDAGQRGQVAVVLPLLEGTDGIQKMSKSLGNHISISEPPEEMYGKLMSISDELMERYYTLLSQAPEHQQGAIARGDIHPMEAKKALAEEVVGRFWGVAEAARAARFFEERFQKRRPHEPLRVRVRVDGDTVWICQLLKEIGFAPSTSEGRRLVAQGAVRVDGKPVDVNFRFRRDVHRLVEVGRRRLAEVVFESTRSEPERG